MEKEALSEKGSSLKQLYQHREVSMSGDATGMIVI